MWPDPQETEDLVTFTKEILNGKLQFLCSVMRSKKECLITLIKLKAAVVSEKCSIYFFLLAISLFIIVF